MVNIPDDKKPLEKETPDEKPIEYSYDDVHKPTTEEIAENKEVPEEKPEKPEVKPEVKEEKPVVPEVKEEKPEDKIEADKLAEEISAKVAEKLIPQDEKTPQDKYDAFFDKIQKEKGRDPNWKELSQFNEDQAVATVLAKQKEETEARQAEEANIKKANEEFTKRFNSQIDEELDELYKSDNLTAIVDPNNPSDQGVMERKALFQAMLDTNAKRAAEGKDSILSISRIFHGYYTKPNAQPAGEEAPVSMGKGTPSDEGGEELDYAKDVHRPWSLFGKR